mmetsp:Transcript_13697/g.38921  ORF Transcript_13697/g.38921 Transcript_13697/m.38921 type:complete len:222 (-) Transcript_13697:1725-2390(-)
MASSKMFRSLCSATKPIFSELLAHETDSLRAPVPHTSWYAGFANSRSHAAFWRASASACCSFAISVSFSAIASAARCFSSASSFSIFSCASVSSCRALPFSSPPSLSEESDSCVFSRSSFRAFEYVTSWDSSSISGRPSVGTTYTKMHLDDVPPNASLSLCFSRIPDAASPSFPSFGASSGSEPASRARDFFFSRCSASQSLENLTPFTKVAFAAPPCENR